MRRCGPCAVRCYEELCSPGNCQLLLTTACCFCVTGAAHCCLCHRLWVAAGCRNPLHQVAVPLPLSSAHRPLSASTPTPPHHISPYLAAKYIFEYPAGWKSETINKRDKGTQGIDCRVRLLVLREGSEEAVVLRLRTCRRCLYHAGALSLSLHPQYPPTTHCFTHAPPQVYNPKNKLQQVFVITLGRAGEDNRSFRLNDIDSTLAGFAGADYDMLVSGGLYCLPAGGVDCTIRWAGLAAESLIPPPP